MNAILGRTCAALLLAGAVGGARAADSAPAETDKLAGARAQIAARHWPAAIAELKRVDDVGSADWNNLMGYTARKADPPDLAASETYYEAALRIDPKHRGTLEYSGELYLMKGDLPKAEQRLAALDKLCRLPCAEYTTLKKSIERYKGSGGKLGTYD